MEYLNMKLLSIISKPFARNEDIELLMNCSKASAQKVRKEIEEEILNDGMKLTPVLRAVPMSRVIGYLQIDVSRIARLAKIEAEIQCTLAKEKATVGAVTECKSSTDLPSNYNIVTDGKSNSH